MRQRRSEPRRRGLRGAVWRGLVRRSGLVLTLLVLAGCAGQVPPEPRTVRVEVPIAVPCRAPDVAVPAWATDSLKKEDGLEVKVRALLAERRQRIGYELLLVAALQACQ